MMTVLILVLGQRIGLVGSLIPAGRIRAGTVKRLGQGAVAMTTVTQTTVAQTTVAQTTVAQTTVALAAVALAAAVLGTVVEVIREDLHRGGIHDQLLQWSAGRRMIGRS